MADRPSPKADALRAMREANFQAAHRGTTREKPMVSLSTPVNREPCDYRQPKTGLQCVKEDKGHGGHHKYKKPDTPTVDDDAEV